MNRIMLSFLAFILVIMFTGSSRADYWEKISNPYKIGTVEDLSVGHDTEDNVYVFAATSTDSCFLWVSTNNGVSWSKSNKVTGHTHTHVIVQQESFEYGWTLVPSSSGNTDNDAGPYYTTNKGALWTKKASGLSDNKKLTALAAVLSSTNLSTAYVGCEGNSSNSYEKIFRTTDGGDNWSLRQGTGGNKIPDDDLGVVNDIAICQSQASKIYCAYEGESGDPVYRSLDGGANWIGIPIEYDEDQFVESAMAIAVYTHPETVLVVEKSPIEGRVWITANATSQTVDWAEASARLDYSSEVDGYLGCNRIRIYEDGAYFAFNTKDDSDDYHWVAKYCYL